MYEKTVARVSREVEGLSLDALRRRLVESERRRRLLEQLLAPESQAED